MGVLSAGLTWGDRRTGCYGEGTQNARMLRFFSGGALIFRAESVSYALGKRDLEVSLWTGQCEETVRPTVSWSPPQWICSPIPSQLKCLKPTSPRCFCLLHKRLSHSLSGAMLTVDVLPPCSSQKLLHLLVFDMSALKFAVTSQFY